MENKEVQRDTIKSFRRTVWAHYRKYGRELPWRRTADPYAIVVSEIMLQQTQVERVRGKYEEFLKRFPTFASLAGASAQEVLHAWQGLGYNRRALSLLKLARIVIKKHKGKFPRDLAELCKLPGVGRATAGSIAAFAFNVPAVFIETNIRRSLLHHFFPKKKKVPEEKIETLAAAVLDKKSPRKWYWALMDYGSMLGKTLPNANRRSSYYRKQSIFKGSDRELRGRILRILLEKSHIPVSALLGMTEKSEDKIYAILAALEKEGFLHQKKGIVMIAK